MFLTRFLRARTGAHFAGKRCRLIDAGDWSYRGRWRDTGPPENRRQGSYWWKPVVGFGVMADFVADNALSKLALVCAVQEPAS